jgi:choline monooxygenase
VAFVETLPVNWYRDREVWERERQTIFAVDWIHVAYSYQFAESGGYVADTIAGWPFLIHRSGDGQLRAFHNVCPHRAGPIYYDGEGCTHALVCRYHGWSFRQDGKLARARDFGGDVPEGMDLRPIRVAEWRGFVFICLSNDTAPLEEWLGGFPEVCEPYDFEGCEFHSRTVRHMKCNWKTYGDNYLENYHVPLVHPDMAIRDLEARKSRSQRSGDPRWNYQSAPKKEGGLVSGMYTYFWPNFALDIFPGGFAVERYVPKSLTETDLIFDYFFVKGAEQVDDIVKASEVVVDEDVLIVEAVQRNLDAGLYQTGWLSPRHENGVADWQKMLRERVGEIPARA